MKDFKNYINIKIVYFLAKLNVQSSHTIILCRIFREYMRARAINLNNAIINE